MSMLEVPEGERGVIRVFALAARPQDMDDLAMARALGVDRLDMSGVEIFPVSDLAGIGLEGYLREGLGVSAEAVVPGTLDGVGETVAIVHSAAFNGHAVMLDPQMPLELAAVYREADGAPGDLMPLSSAGASGGLTSVEEADLVPDTRSKVWLVVVGLVIGLVIGFLLVFASGGS